MSHTEQVYGIHAVHSLLEKSPQQVLQLFIQKNRHDKKMADIERLADTAGIKIQWADKRKLDQKQRGNHQGVIAEAQVFDARMNESELLNLAKESEQIKLLILDGVTDPHNLGACLRTADAAGVSALVVPKDKAASLNATARKVACGAAEQVPVIKVTNLVRFIEALKEQQVWIYGTAGEAESDIYQATMPQKIALIMGAEGDGMRRLTREHCDQLIKIPMAGSVSSLNVSVATGVCLFEIVRQQSR